MESKLKELCLQLFEVGALKFGEFKMKVGVNSPVYFDLRIMISYPKIMRTLSELLWDFVLEKGIKCDVVCGVPYTALPLATLIAVNAGLPMLIRRKEAKDYGTKKLIEGVFEKGDLCIIFEDVVTTGSSILETVKDLKGQGLVVTDSVVVLNREQGGVGNLAKEGITMWSLLTLTQVLKFLKEDGKIDEDMYVAVKMYILENQLDPKGEPIRTAEVSRLEMSLASRAVQSTSPVAKQLFQLMTDKQSTLCVAVDVSQASELLRLAAAVGPHVALLKTHSDIVHDWTTDTASQLQQLAKQHNFLILEDRKFADIGNTVRLQYGLVHSWAHLVTVHGLSGDGVLQGIEEEVRRHSEPRGVFLVAQLSCRDNLITPQYTKCVMRQAASHPALVAGLVCQSADVVVSPGLLQLTPGVSLSRGSDPLGQQYNTPHNVVCKRGADLSVVGRAIITSPDPAAAAHHFQTALWDAYLKRITK